MWKWRRLGVVVAVVGLAALLPVSLAQTVTFPREEFSQDVLEATAEFRTGSLGLDASQLLSAIDPIIDDFSSLFADDPTLAADFQDDLELALELSASRSQFDLELFQQLVEIALDRLAVARLEFELFFVVENNFDQAGIRLDQINLKARVSDLANGLIANSDIRADFIENVNTVIDRSVETVGTAAASDQGRQIVMTDVLELGLQAALERLDRDNIQQRLPALADRLLGGVATLSDRVRFQEALMLLLRRLDVTRNLIRGDNRDLQDALLGRAVVRRGEVGTLGTRGRRPTPVVRGGATVIDQQSPLPLAPRPLLPSTGLHQPQSRVARLETQLLTAIQDAVSAAITNGALDQREFTTELADAFQLLEVSQLFGLIDRALLDSLTGSNQLALAQFIERIDVLLEDFGDIVVDDVTQVFPEGNRAEFIENLIAIIAPAVEVATVDVDRLQTGLNVLQDQLGR